MKIFGKKIGSKILNIVFGGKPKTIETKTPEEMDELVSLVKKASENDLEAVNELKQKLNKKEEELLNQFGGVQVKEISKEIEKVENKKAEIVTKIENNKKYESLLKSDIFEVVDNKVYLKGFKAELPPVLIDEFIALLAANKDITDLVDFWKLNLTNENPEARRGLYNFIKKQKLLIAKHGYFIAFRRILPKEDSKKVDISKFSAQELDFLHDYVAKVKKWKKSLKSYEIYKENGKVVVRFIKNTSHIEGYGSLHDFVNSSTNTEEIFTDAYTKTMTIKIGQPVSIDRSKCDKDSKRECSFGLHVGSQSFVLNNNHFGSVIVACLINPQHVISVPYSDAHKMRVCEYLPFMILTEQELRDFHKLDIYIPQYSTEYKKIEADKLKAAYDVIDSLSKDDLKKFATKDYDPTVSEEDLKEIQEQRVVLDSELSKIKKQLGQVLGDDISQELDLQEIKAIIASRIS